MKLTQKEDLFVEVLVSRHRLGESLWTFDIKHSNTATRLVERGLVSITGGAVDNTFRAWLTNEGQKKFMKQPYDSPALKKNQAALDSIGRSAKAILADIERVL